MLHVFTGRKCENIIYTVRESVRARHVVGEDSTIEPTTHMQIRPTMSHGTLLGLEVWRAVTLVDGVIIVAYNCIAI